MSDPEVALKPWRVQPSPINQPAWRLSLMIVLGSILAWGVHRLLGGHNAFSVWIAALVLTGTWFTAIRFLLLETRFRIFWMIYLVLAGATLVAFGPNEAGRYIAIPTFGVFLFFRTYAPYQRMLSARRAKIFFLGLIAAGFVSVGWGFSGGEVSDLPWLHGLAENLARTALGALRLFWIFSLLNLFFRIRLHFMRLKPKLAVSALFIAGVPLVLVLIFMILLLYGTLGGSLATRGRGILEDWSAQTAAGKDLSGTTFTDYFTLTIPEDPSTGPEVPEPPKWIGLFVTALQTPLKDAEALNDDETGTGVPKPNWAPADTTAYFLIESEIWLINVRGLSAGPLRLSGYHVNQDPLDYLAKMLRCDVGLYTSQAVTVDSDDPRYIESPEDTSRLSIDIKGFQNRAESGADSALSIWNRPMKFGGDLLQTLRLVPGGFRHKEIVFHLQARLANLVKEFATENSKINQAVIAVLAFLGILFLILEGFALFLGIRITTGITSAVNSLHSRTLRLAAGDLDSYVQISNEDEFGVLADSFNDMTVAVRHGREEAVARERLERELQMAREIQERLLPHDSPTISGFEVTGISLPSLQVGGDYFDFLTQGDGRLGIAIGDVSGKGIPAALLMSNLQASLQGQVIHPSSVGEIVNRVNDLMVHSTHSQRFVTFFYGVLDINSCTFTSTNAGHNPPILLRADGAVEYLEKGGLLIGMLPGQAYQQETVSIKPGDVLVLYTDGVTEAEGPVPGDDDPTGKTPPGKIPPEEIEDEKTMDNMFGEERLLQVIRQSSHLPVAGIREAILKAVLEHAAGVPQSDDVTMVIIKRHPLAEPDGGTVPQDGSEANV
ncbi:MAG: SpoIIE family protein phosphatase [Candidatus Eisenbacteria bacterium]|uniref:SpoIIE family protein phosphatase n=1 Tax=Eiseniibacteriota bacterium TaxID=2212470 RepID=A0A948RYS2_UNCEI|nr:SpoIIE family protein phosphatase [Candidatus Eisenbacteria bacterium]MBU1947702.1 SpoIIE family protein phosphatase [Candidatus Eisenbacteria bacterium]MBU2692054.1 SpoIIE family protein phosphatase [Candidatus Eisenbacteria bacterium]